MSWLRSSTSIVLGLALGCVADLRPATLPLAPDAQTRSDGTAQIEAVAVAHGLERWQRFSRARFQLDDAAMPSCMRGGLIGLGSDQRLEISLALRDRTARARFVGGPRAGQTIGVKGELAYRLNAQEGLEFAENSCVEDYLLSLQRSLFLPLSLAARVESGEASAFAAGERSLAGSTYDLVFVTLPGSYGSTDDEQFVLWKSRTSGRIEWLERTDRRRSARAQLALHYMDYRDVDGVQVPTRIERSQDIDDSAERSVTLSDIALD